MPNFIKVDIYTVRLLDNSDKSLEARLQKKVQDVDGTIISDMGCLKGFMYMTRAGSKNPLDGKEDGDILIQYHGEGTMAETAPN